LSVPLPVVGLYSNLGEFQGLRSFAMSGDREKILATGCDDYLAKPFNVQEFLRMVERYTSGNRNRRPDPVN